jgi:hypothetical protein
MNFHHLADNLAGEEDIVHPIVTHCPSIANVRDMKLRWFSSLLIDAFRGLTREGIEMKTTRVAVAKDIIDQNLGSF